jgi:hypothetical protein
MRTVVDNLHEKSVFIICCQFPNSVLDIHWILLDWCSGPCWMDWIDPYIQSIQSINITDVIKALMLAINFHSL